ncbi:MAG: hypothetical protein JHC93_03015 [Parachlamydiales bacterium]|nr:hypothetical protein [Parachlamydiales bacterium]
MSVSPAQSQHVVLCHVFLDKPSETHLVEVCNKLYKILNEDKWLELNEKDYGIAYKEKGETWHQAYHLNSKEHLEKLDEIIQLNMKSPTDECDLEELFNLAGSPLKNRDVFYIERQDFLMDQFKNCDPKETLSGAGAWHSGRTFRLYCAKKRESYQSFKDSCIQHEVKGGTTYVKPARRRRSHEYNVTPTSSYGQFRSDKQDY